MKGKRIHHMEKSRRTANIPMGGGLIGVVAEFFFLALLFQCGIAPLSWDDCQPERPPAQAPVTVRGEEVQAP